MKKYSLSGALLCVVFTAFEFAGCTKSEISTQPDFANGTGATTADAINPALCKIRTVRQPYGGGTTLGKFTYNGAGDPISLLYQNGDPGTGNANYFFYYNNQGKLIKMTRTYQQQAIVVETHRYGYSQYGSISSDTLDATEGNLLRIISLFKYDSQGRIIQELRKHVIPVEPSELKTYTYDNKGNLVISGYPSSNYDNKVNPLRIHSVFQFVNRNYSMNNPSAATAYNSKGLPLNTATYHDQLFSTGPSQITYDCQ